MDDPKPAGDTPSVKLPTTLPIMGETPKGPTVFAKNSVTIMSYLLLTFFAMACVWSLSMLGLKGKFVSVPEVAAVMVKYEEARDILNNHYSGLWWLMFVVFFISATSAGGCLKRRIWSLRMLRTVTWFWCGVLIFLAAWCAGRAMGLLDWSPVGNDGGIRCVVLAVLTFVVRYVLDRGQVKSQFGAPAPKKLAFLPGVMMIPDMDLTARPSEKVPTP